MSHAGSLKASGGVREVGVGLCKCSRINKEPFYPPLPSRRLFQQPPVFSVMTLWQETTLFKALSPALSLITHFQEFRAHQFFPSPRKGDSQRPDQPSLSLAESPPPRVPRASLPGRRLVFWVVLAPCRSQRPFIHSRGPGPPPSPSRSLAGPWEIAPPPRPLPRLAFISKALAFGII